MTTSEMRNTEDMIEKVANINSIRSKKSTQLIAEGKTALDPYTFDFLLLCNKICGASHYNMQMKIVVDSPEDYKKWLKEKVTVVQSVKADAAAEADSKEDSTKKDSTSVKKETIVAQTVVMK